MSTISKISDCFPVANDHGVCVSCNEQHQALSNIHFVDPLKACTMEHEQQKLQGSPLTGLG